ncbi:hypothetical protein [Microbacterium binotii]|uniref:Restriction endonuclease type IV Mrr domain-containing protein n=1 Tax=Microbacterium binotii TaxID=462710 RepID=A0ABN3PBT7_9MICO
MTRSRKSARSAGTAHETSIATYLAAALDDDRIERRARNGAKDRGDISGVRTALGERVVIEAKDYGGQIKAAEWVKEAHVEAGNDDAPVGVVVAKRRGTTNPADQYVITTLGDLVVLLGGRKDPT